MSTSTEEFTDEQKEFCIWLIERWDSQVVDPFPKKYTYGFIAKSLNDMGRAGLPIEVVKESMVIAMDREQVPAHEKWVYGCGIAWKKFRQDRPLRDLVNEWKEAIENEDKS